MPAASTLLLAATCAGGFLQVPAVTPGAITGFVYEENSRVALGGALVTITALVAQRNSSFDGAATSETDGDGRFEFPRLQEGPYLVHVQKAGFLLHGASDLRKVYLRSGERLTVTLLLQRGGAIAGRVIDAYGESVGNARVFPMQAAHPGDCEVPPGSLVPAGRMVETNDLGEYRLYGLRPGRYYVLADPATHHEFPIGHRSAVPLPTYYGSTPHERAAQPIDVAPGQTFGDAVIEVATAPAFQISGLVRQPTGEPVAGAQVYLSSDPGGAHRIYLQRSQNTRTDTAGRFTLGNVPDGVYTLTAAAPEPIAGPPHPRTSPPRRGPPVAVTVDSGSVGNVVLSVRSPE